MMKLKTYIFTAIMAVSMVGCLEKLPIDAIPADKAINTVEEADQFMIGIYSSFLSGSLSSLYLSLLPALPSDVLFVV